MATEIGGRRAITPPHPRGCFANRPSGLTAGTGAGTRQRHSLPGSLPTTARGGSRSAGFTSPQRSSTSLPSFPRKESPVSIPYAQPPAQHVNNQSTQGHSSNRGDVSVCVRLRPGCANEMCTFVDSANCIRVSSCGVAAYGKQNNEAVYSCDAAFGPEATQEEVYEQAVAPICQSVLEGYNGAVIAYGQTGSGKTHTIVGDANNAGIIPRALQTIFASLRTRKHWSVEVCVLEIYQERARDLLALVDEAVVEIHEMVDGRGENTFHCPDAVRRKVANADEALAALVEGIRRRETAPTDMNHSSSRSHLIFTLSTVQSDDALKATLHSKLHLVDLAGSERLKRSMVEGRSPSRLGRESFMDISKTPRDQRREAGHINRSLMHLALVIHRLTQSHGRMNHIPYRDSLLTRLLADSFGGSSKTCLIINCSALVKDREETQGSLEFGKRAGLVRNAAQINIEIEEDPSDVVKALVAKQVASLKRDHEKMQRNYKETRRCLREAVRDALDQQARRKQEVMSLENKNCRLEGLWLESATAAANVGAESTAEIKRLHDENLALQQRVQEMSHELIQAKETLGKVMQQLFDQATSASAEVANARVCLEKRCVKTDEALAVRDASLCADAQIASTSVAKEVELRKLRTANFETEAKQLQDRWSHVLEDGSDEECNDNGTHVLPAEANSDSELEEPRHEQDFGELSARKLDVAFNESTDRSEQRPETLKKSPGRLIDHVAPRVVDPTRDGPLLRSPDPRIDRFIACQSQSSPSRRRVGPGEDKYAMKEMVTPSWAAAPAESVESLFCTSDASQSIRHVQVNVRNAAGSPRPVPGGDLSSDESGHGEASPCIASDAMLPAPSLVEPMPNVVDVGETWREPISPAAEFQNLPIFASEVDLR